MSKVTERAYFDSVLACAQCGWWQDPRTRIYGFPACCPDCGGKLQSKIGRLRVRETDGFLCGPQTDFLSFTPKESQP